MEFEKRDSNGHQAERWDSMRLHSAPMSGNGYKVRLLLGLLDKECEVVDYNRLWTIERTGGRCP